jgi:hypothetical protein
LLLHVPRCCGRLCVLPLLHLVVVLLPPPLFLVLVLMQVLVLLLMPLVLVHLPLLLFLLVLRASPAARYCRCSSARSCCNKEEARQKLCLW